MKFQAFSLASLAFATAINAQSIRGTRKVLTNPVAVLELSDEANVEFFDGGDTVLMVGSSTEDSDELDLFSSELRELGPVEAYEDLSSQVAPAELVQAQKRVDEARARNSTTPFSLLPSDEEGFLGSSEDEDEGGHRRRLVSCNTYSFQTGNQAWWTNTNGMSALITPTSGCVGVTIEILSGGGWLSTGASKFVCTGYAGLVAATGPYAAYRTRVYSAIGDVYHVKICWN